MPVPFPACNDVRSFDREREVTELRAIIAVMEAPCGCRSDTHGGSFSPWCLKHGRLAVLFPTTPKPHNHIKKPGLKKFL